MYNRLYKYLTTAKLLFGFQTSFLTEYVIVQLELFEPDHNTLGVSIDLSKVTT